MAGKKDAASINENIEKYKEYFKDDLEAINEELTKSKHYSEIIDKEIEMLSESNSFGTNKGTQHYLIEHIANAVQLQTQRQGLRRDMFTIKKTIIDYSQKFAEENATEESNLTEALERLLKQDKQEKNTIQQTNNQSDDDLDSQIDKTLGEE